MAEVCVCGGKKSHSCLKLKACLMLRLSVAHLISGTGATLSFKCSKLDSALNQRLAPDVGRTQRMSRGD